MAVELNNKLTAHEVMATNREAWLRAVSRAIVTDILEPEGYGFHADLMQDDVYHASLTEKLNVSCSWPSKGGIARKKRTVGQCWGNMASKGNEVELFISPTLDTAFEVAEVLVHELLHAAVGTREKHNRRFARGCAVLGLEGKPTATKAGPELAGDLKALLLAFPEYPHKGLEYVAPLKSEKSRQLKVYCKNDEKCPSFGEGGKGFLFRLTRTWIEQLRAGNDAEEDPRLVMVCPFCNASLAVELPIDEDEKE